jgi:hypothetical protein
VEPSGKAWKSLEDQEIPGGEIVLLRWRYRVIDGKTWNLGSSVGTLTSVPPQSKNRHTNL